MKNVAKFIIRIPKSVVGILPTYQDQVLLCKRAIQPRQGFWTLPAGFHKMEESTLEGAIRECKEETGASVMDPTLYAIFDIPQISQVYIFFKGELKNKAFRPLKSHLRSGYLMKKISLGQSSHSQ